MNQSLLNLSDRDYNGHIRIALIGRAGPMTLSSIAHTFLIRGIELLSSNVDQLTVALALQDEAHLKVFFAEFRRSGHRRSALVRHTLLRRAHLSMAQMIVALALRHDYYLSGVQRWYTHG